MFEVEIHREFCAAHALVVRGEREAVHGHNFRVTVVLEGARLDEDELLLDFHAVEGMLDEVIRPFANADLNKAAVFREVNPSAEAIAWCIGEAMSREVRGLDDGRGVRVARVSVTEAPGCRATYVLDDAGSGGPEGAVR